MIRVVKIFTKDVSKTLSCDVIVEGTICKFVCFPIIHRVTAA